MTRGLHLVPFLCCALGGIAHAQAQRPDVVLLVWDDVAQADVDQVATPNLDAMAAEGASWTRAYAHPWCAPTRNSIYQGVWDGRHRGHSCAGVVPETLDDGVSSLAKAFDAQGYATYLIGKWHQGEASTPGIPWTHAPHLHGFDHWRNGYANTTYACSPAWPPGGRVDDGVITTDPRHHTIREREALFDAFVESRQKGEPLFAVVGCSDAHSPFSLPPSSILPAGYLASLPQKPTDRQKFEAEIVALDFVLGELRAALPRDTWFFVVGDNGTPSKVAPNPRRAKRTVFERGVHVPLVASRPSMRGEVFDDPVHVVDLFPTLMRAMEWTPPPGLDGQDLFHPTRGWAFVHLPGESRALIERRWKLIDSGRGTTERLYDLELDPDELKPLPPFGPDYQRLRERLLRLPG